MHLALLRKSPNGKCLACIMYYFSADDTVYENRQEEQQQQQHQELRLLAPAIPANAAKELANDISVIMRERVKLGYSMEVGDPKMAILLNRVLTCNTQIRTNIDIVKEDHKMKELWSWIYRMLYFIESSSESLILLILGADKLSRDMSQVISYNFQGVHGIWSGPGKVTQVSCKACFLFDGH